MSMISYGNLQLLKLERKKLVLESKELRKLEFQQDKAAAKHAYYDRTYHVRNKIRAINLAIAFMIGKQYNKVEPKLTVPQQKYVHRLVFKKVVSSVKRHVSKGFDTIILLKYGVDRSNVNFDRYLAEEVNAWGLFQSE